MRNRFDRELIKLENSLIDMGERVEKITKMAFNSLLDRDLDLARVVVKFDETIDELEIKIEKKCINLIALQQPLASDLREITATFKIITDLERIGDYAVNIAKVVLEFGDEEFIKPLIDLPKMNEIVLKMIHNAMEAFVKKDVIKAREVAKLDDEVDLLYEKIYNELLDMVNKDNKDQVIRFLFIGRHLERSADHITNICERIIYMLEGVRENY